MMADSTWQHINQPHRKPLPQHLAPQPSPTYSNSSSQNPNIYAHSRSRTTSSNIFPIPPNQNQNQNYYPSNNNMLSGTYTSRRTPSTNTFSTTGSSSTFNRAPSADLPRRSTSRGSATAHPTSYVALMRKQKATVWCDRAQTEDPRLLAAQKAAKIRAASEVMGPTAGRTSTSLSSSGISSTNRVAAKIRHHGKSGLTGYQAATENFGVGVGGVPMRLSASEVEGGDSDDDDHGSGVGLYHHRTGSGRSSLGSQTRRTGLQYRASGASGNSSGRWSSGNTPPSERNGSGLGMGASQHNSDGLNDLAEETPMPAGHVKAKDYFDTSGTTSMTSGRSGGSGSSGERADGLGDLGSDAARLASNSLLKSTMTREKSTRNPEELRRRGSVDERTMTITGGVGRLFVANPDLSDED